MPVSTTEGWRLIKILPPTLRVALYGTLAFYEGPFILILITVSRFRRFIAINRFSVNYTFQQKKYRSNGKSKVACNYFCQDVLCVSEFFYILIHMKVE